jgi:hypothetical protein
LHLLFHLAAVGAHKVQMVLLAALEAVGVVLVHLVVLAHLVKALRVVQVLHHKVAEEAVQAQ